MFRLTREVRIGVNAGDAGGWEDGGRPTNSYAGFPSLRGLGCFFTVRVTVGGELQRKSNYLLNIKEVDRRVRELGVALLTRWVREGRTSGGRAAADLFEVIARGWDGVNVVALRLGVSPFLSWQVLAEEFPVVRLSQKFEFSATHRLHNPALGDEENRKTYGKCNNPHGHGHNYEVQVTVAGPPGAGGVVWDVTDLERVVAETVIDRFDHKNLNVEVPEFRELIPSVENISMVIYRLLKPKLSRGDVLLAGVTVWETPKTWCEYTE